MLGSGVDRRGHVANIDTTDPTLAGSRPAGTQTTGPLVWFGRTEEGGAELLAALQFLAARPHRPLRR